MRKIVFTMLVVGGALSTTAPAQAGLLVSAQLLPISTPADSQTDAVFATTTESVAIEQSVAYPGLTESDPQQVFIGSAAATATLDTYRLDTRLELQNYLRKNYVWSTGQGQNGNEYSFIYTPAVSIVTLTDEITVTGGTGVYSLNYTLGLDGLVSSDNGLLSAFLQVSLSLPEGVGQTTFFTFGPGDEVPSEITLTYDELPFGGPINPALSIFAVILPSPLTEAEVPDFGNDLITGTATVQFGATVTLKQLTATDPSGNLLSGLSLTSGSGFEYPTDPGNLNQQAVPEPGTFTLLAPIAALALLRAVRRGRRT
jgi:hypothetical protein